MVAVAGNVDARQRRQMSAHRGVSTIICSRSRNISVKENPSQVLHQRHVASLHKAMSAVAGATTIVVVAAAASNVDGDVNQMSTLTPALTIIQAEKVNIIRNTKLSLRTTLGTSILVLEQAFPYEYLYIYYYLGGLL